jgi:CheY-like chemotaxis protein
MPAQLNPIRTLIVDDSEDECILLHEELRGVASLKLIGFVHDGIEAIAYIRGTDQFKDREMFPYPDLMLLDYKMPRCNGIQVLDFLRRQFHRPRVILWSNTLEQVNVPLALRLGADLVCRKPATRLELMEIINRFEINVFNKAVDRACAETGERVSQAARV